MINILYFTGITEKIHDRYVNTGKVSETVIAFIAHKVIKNRKLTEFETNIFYGKTREINQYILEHSK